MLAEEDIILAQKGDKDAFMRIILDSQDSLYRVSKGILRNDNDCADAIQNAIEKAYDSISKLKKANYFKTWMIRILINECYNILKLKNKSVAIETVDIMATYEMNLDESIDLTAAINQLESHYRSVIILFYLEDYTINEIAEILQVGPGTVKSRLNRARTKLGSFLGVANVERRAKNE
ncbi:sigma-70 family RNA polymerase sigma factor [Virgibacillus flavescens]|uniref:sigma-70 family RNA polymerase sigma factor n=1 Tax=Virgibacillus flavescens TaxID=1611422 RepID=UPI003D349DBF